MTSYSYWVKVTAPFSEIAQRIEGIVAGSSTTRNYEGGSVSFNLTARSREIFEYNYALALFACDVYIRGADKFSLAHLFPPDSAPAPKESQPSFIQQNSRWFGLR